jgi:hypothetical protein
MTNARLVSAHHAHLFPQAPLGLFFFALALHAGLFVEFALLHLTKETFLLQLALENPDGFFDIIVDHVDLHLQSPRFLYRFPLGGEECGL